LCKVFLTFQHYISIFMFSLMIYKLIKLNGIIYIYIFFFFIFLFFHMKKPNFLYFLIIIHFFWAFCNFFLYLAACLCTLINNYSWCSLWRRQIEYIWDCMLLFFSVNFPLLETSRLPDENIRQEIFPLDRGEGSFFIPI